MIVKLLGAVFCGFAVFVLSPSATAQVLFGATSSGGPGELFILDRSTGGVLQNVGPLNDANGLNYPISGLAFHPTTGVLYGSTGNFFAETRALFVRIDPTTARVTVIGPFNVGNPTGNPATMADLAFDLSTGQLFGVGSVAGPQLYSINLATGQATVIGDTGLTSTTGGGLAASISGVVYGTPTAARFGTYDRTTGAFTNIANPDKPAGGGAYAALDFDASGILFGLNSGPGTPPPTHLVTIDPTTGAVTDHGPSVPALDAIAFAIPEPGSASLLLGSAAVLLTSKRRRD